jgi:hypothetical protein
MIVYLRREAALYYIAESQFSAMKGLIKAGVNVSKLVLKPREYSFKRVPYEGEIGRLRIMEQFMKAKTEMTEKNAVFGALLPETIRVVFGNRPIDLNKPASINGSE